MQDNCIEQNEQNANHSEFKHVGQNKQQISTENGDKQPLMNKANNSGHRAAYFGTWNRQHNLTTIVCVCPPHLLHPFTASCPGKGKGAGGSEKRLNTTIKTIV